MGGTGRLPDHIIKIIERMKEREKQTKLDEQVG